MNDKPFDAKRLAPVLLVAAVASVAAWRLATYAQAAAPDAPAPVMQRVGNQIVVGEKSPLRRTLRVEAAAEQVSEVPFTLPASVEADPARWLKVLPPAAGRIVSLDKRLGDAVQRGELLFRIDAPDLAQARSDVQKARAALELARTALQRQRSLATDEIAAGRDIEQAQSDFDQARSELVRAEARLAQLGTSAGTTLDVRSPISGRVVELAAAEGASWNDPTMPLMTVADLSTVFVTASAGERDLGAVFVGQPVRVVLDAYPAEPLVGTVRYVGEVLDADTRRVKLRMSFANREGRLKPGMFATATLFRRPHRNLSVPLTAVVQNGFHARVFVEVQPWRFEPRVVELGPRVGDRIEIVSGLKSGERIVVADGVVLDD